MSKDNLFISPSEIRTGRAQFGLTQKDLAIEMGTCASAISKWETGSIVPNPSSTRKLLDFFGLEKRAEAKVKPLRTFEEALEEAKTNPEVMTAEAVRSASITIEDHTTDARSFFLEEGKARKFYTVPEQKKNKHKGSTFGVCFETSISPVHRSRARQPVSVQKAAKRSTDHCRGGGTV